MVVFVVIVVVVVVVVVVVDVDDVLVVDTDVTVIVVVVVDITLDNILPFPSFRPSLDVIIVNVTLSNNFDTLTPATTSTTASSPPPEHGDNGGNGDVDCELCIDEHADDDVRKSDDDVQTSCPSSSQLIAPIRLILEMASGRTPMELSLLIETLCDF